MTLAGYDEENHNCLGCHLDTESQLIKNFLTNALYIQDSYVFFRLYTFQLYLYSEKILEMVKIVGLPESYRKGNFFVFYEIKLWTNFLKHPKAFILTHHPRYIFETDNEIPAIKANTKLKKLDFEFIRRNRLIGFLKPNFYAQKIRLNTHLIFINDGFLTTPISNGRLKRITCTIS